MGSGVGAVNIVLPGNHGVNGVFARFGRREYVGGGFRGENIVGAR